MKYPLQELDNLQYRLTCAAGLVGTVQECMVHGDAAAEEYSDALYGACDYLYGINKEMRKAVDAAFQERRDNREAGEHGEAQS